MNADSHHLGAHSIRRDGDVLVLKWVGDLLAEHIGVIHARLESMLTEHNFVFVLVDAKDGGSISPEARKRAATWAHVDHFGGTAIFHASLPIRAVSAIATSLQRLLVPQKVAAIKITDTEDAARAWINARRRELQSQGA